MTATLKERLKDAEIIEFEKPRPLRRSAGKSSPYPVEALGPIIGPAVRGATDVVQLPAVIAAHSALAAAALAVQGHADIELAHGETNPVSLFLLSVAHSGDRKSSADKLLSQGQSTRETELQESFTGLMSEYINDKDGYDTARSVAKSGKQKGRVDIAAALKAVGDEPTRPRFPSFTADDPTVEGIHKYLATGQPSLGVFSDEGAQFTGGFGMAKENASKTAAALSNLWDAKTIKRMRAGEGFSVLRGRRVSMHLMIQPDAASAWLSNEHIKGQGLFGRFLLAAPESLAGARFHKVPQPQSHSDIARFNNRTLEIFRQPLPYIDEATGELKPRLLRLSPAAKSALTAYSDVIEKERGPSGRYASIREFANKVVSHVARLSAVLALFNDMHTPQISALHLEKGIKLVEWYLEEMLRVNNAGHVTPDIAEAEKQLVWLQEQWPQLSTTGDDGRLVSLPDIYQLGPYSIRDAAQARVAVETLMRHGWVRKVNDGGRHRVNGSLRSEVYSINRGE